MSVNGYEVAVVNPASGTCEGWQGHTVRIAVTGGAPLVFVIAGGVPKVGPAGNLRPDAANGRKLVNDNTPQSVHVVSQGGGEQSCPLGATSEVWLWPIK
jgi:hypothetical protein